MWFLMKHFFHISNWSVNLSLFLPYLNPPTLVPSIPFIIPSPRTAIHSISTATTVPLPTHTIFYALPVADTSKFVVSTHSAGTTVDAVVDKIEIKFPILVVALSTSTIENVHPMGTKSKARDL